MSPLLVRYEGDYIDDHKVPGLRFMSKDQWKEFLHRVQFGWYPYEHEFGTNQTIHYDTPSQLEECLTVITVDGATFSEMKPILDGANSFGLFPEGPENDISEYDERYEAKCLACGQRVSVYETEDLEFNGTDFNRKWRYQAHKFPDSNNYCSMGFEQVDDPEFSPEPETEE